MKTLRLLLILLPVFAGALGAPAETSWSDWRFLLGDWIGEGAGEPGHGKGGFTFSPDLQGAVLVRRSHAEYPADKDRPAFAHDDLMVIYQAAAARALRADYFDNEGHIIHYQVELAPSHNAVTFLSEPSVAAPQYRLTYTLKANGQVAIRFEIAPPGKPFATYVDATARRK